MDEKTFAAATATASVALNLSGGSDSSKSDILDAVKILTSGAVFLCDYAGIDREKIEECLRVALREVPVRPPHEMHARKQ